VQASIGYQTGDGVCYYMGKLRSGRWSLLDPRHPEAGLKLTYTGGSPCDGDTRRSTQFHFECNPDAGVGVCVCARAVRACVQLFGGGR
jgi:hypothetical protein